MTTRTKSHTYKDHAIFACQQMSIGQCDGRSWHVQTYHGPTGLPYAEEYCPRARTLAEAHEIINERIALASND